MSPDPKIDPYPDYFRVLTLPRRRLADWRARRRASPGWTIVVAVIVAVVLLPVASVIVLAMRPSGGAWSHLVTTVLPDALMQTLLLMAGVGVTTLVVGTLSAWLVTMYRFRGRRILDALLVIPLAVPTYIVAYAWGEILDYTGPVQSALRAAAGWKSRADYWFPDVRSTGGAVLVLSSVLYPYVYLTARASFAQQSACALEVARTLGRTPFGVFTSVALPLARPALAAGLALVLMECLNDLGAVQYLGVRTLSSTIYTTWLQRSNLAGAAQLSVVLLGFVALVLVAEVWARRGRSHSLTARVRPIPFAELNRGWALLAGTLCLIPFAAGFALPSVLLAAKAVAHRHDAFTEAVLRAAGNSVMLASLTALLAVVVGVVLAYARRVAANGFTRPAVQLAGLGYALPGTVMALGVLIPLAALDNQIDDILRRTIGISTGLLLSGTLFALLMAFAARFLAVALGSIEAGLQRISPNLDAVARTLGEGAFSALWRVHLPILMPVLATAGLLVFVDAMKELPATLLLRPFNFETLATQVYSLASLEQLEAASASALIIVAAGLVPVMLLHRALASARPGG